MFSRKQNKITKNRRHQRSMLFAGFEALQSREMMAADLGADDICTPLDASEMPQVAAEVGSQTTNQSNAAATDGTQSNADGFEIVRPAFSLQNRNIVVTGTNFHDTVVVKDLNNGWYEVTGTSKNDAGEELGVRTELFHTFMFHTVRFSAKDGDDVFQNNTGKSSVVYGGEGDDNLRGWGTNCFYGENGHDRLYGSSKADHMYGGSGVDRIYGFGGDDHLDGGSNDDKIWGGGDNDTIYGRGGNDDLYGGAGDDEMHGNDGEDLLEGDTGNDLIFGGAHRDEMYGQDGDDIMLGQEGDDILSGGEDRDSLDGGSGSDNLYGNEGRDELFGRSGLDTLMGGGDRDPLDGGDDNLADNLYGGLGNDIFIRHKHVWTADDPDKFGDFSASEADEVFNDWFGSNYGNDFPSEN